MIIPQHITFPNVDDLLAYSSDGWWVNRSPSQLGLALAGHSHAWSHITSGLPTTLAGYGITDVRLPDAGATFDGDGSQPASGTIVLRPVEVASTIVSASIVGDASGSATVTCRKYTPSAGALGSPTTLGTIALSSAQHNRDTILSGWTTSLATGDVVEFEIGGTITTVTRVTVILERNIV